MTTTTPEQTGTAAAKPEKYATMKEVAAFLGVPLNTAYKMCLARIIPSYKLGKLRRVKLSEVAAWAEGNRVDARPSK